MNGNKLSPLPVLSPQVPITPVQQPPRQAIILDTNILIEISKGKISNPLIAYLLTLRKVFFDLAISHVTAHEFLCGSNKKQQEERIKLIDIFDQYSILAKTIIMSSWLGTIYQKDITVPNSNSISTTDMIVAATAIQIGGLVLTIDGNDFPRPYFDEVQKKTFFYKKGRNDVMTITHLLRPNIQLITQRIKEIPE